jgi:hypothetical protein
MGNELCGERFEDQHNFIPNVQTPGPASKKPSETKAQLEPKEYNQKHEESASKIANVWRENKIKAKEKEDQLNRVRVLEKSFAEIGKFITDEEVKARTEIPIQNLDKKLNAYQGLTVDKAQISQNLIYKRPFQYNLNGSIYHGFWNMNGLREGYGYLIRNDGTKLEGLWKNGEIFKGRIIEVDGSYYEGKIKKTEPNGEGIYTDNNGVDRYRGNFLDGYYHGFGMELFNDNSNYQGNFVRGEMQGKGRLTWDDKSYYEGDFVKSTITGAGIYKSGSHKYNGEWKDNKPDGKGRYDFTNTGSVFYDGAYVKGRKEGEGVFVNSDKNIKYEGQWSCDKPHGNGTYTSPELTVTACWRYGHLIKVIDVSKGETPKNLRIDVPEQLFRNLIEKGHLQGHNVCPNKDSPSKSYRIVTEEKEVLDSLFKNPVFTKT